MGTLPIPDCEGLTGGLGAFFKAARPCHPLPAPARKLAGTGSSPPEVGFSPGLWNIFMRDRKQEVTTAEKTGCSRGN